MLALQRAFRLTRSLHALNVDSHGGCNLSGESAHMSLLRFALRADMPAPTKFRSKQIPTRLPCGLSRRDGQGRALGPIKCPAEPAKSVPGSLGLTQVVDLDLQTPQLLPQIRSDSASSRQVHRSSCQPLLGCFKRAAA